MRSTLFATSLLATFALAQQADAPPSLRIPAFSGYAHPDANAVRRDDDSGAVRECRGELRYYVEFATVGEVRAAVLRGERAKAEFVLSWRGVGDATPTTDGERFSVAAPGTLVLSLKTTDGSPLRDLDALLLTGPAVAGARTLTVERRNASSVHLAYDAPAEHQDDIEWFACECEPTTDPLWSYYMATGWHRGYFGMQVNSPTERRLIFSVWDSGDEAIDRKKVAADDLVQLVKKGDGVVAEGFGHEGTGGHSHLVHDWQLGDRIRFLVHAEPDGTHTTYTGWYQHLRDGKALAGDGWQLLASFRAPKDGRFLHGLYSFSENFSGANGDQLRECLYGPVWLRTSAGEWQQVRAAKFTHDGHGKQWRLDRTGGVRGQRFFLRHGDYATATMAYGTRVELPAAGGPAAPPPLLPQ